jgi:hypothetical protein
MRSHFFPILCSTLLITASFSAWAVTQQSTYINDPTNNETPKSSLILGFASYNDTTQNYLFQNSTQQNYEGTQEIYSGWKWSNGWSFYGIVKSYAENYNQDSTQTFHWVTGDPSLTLGHPLLYKDYNLEIGGQVRAYFTVSNYSSKHNISPYAYYSFLLYRLGAKTEINNALIPRLYYEPNYIVGDTTTYLEDRTSWTRNMNNWFAYGVGQWTQLENHYQKESGYCSEVYPFMNFKLAPNVTLSPRIFFPVMTYGSVYEGPTSVALDNMRAELFFGASL